ncbi:MAG: divalent-cation tolerance protein CutA [Oceanicaulis sp.]
MTEAALIYTTWPDAATAEAAAGTLLDEGLIACANVLGPMRSVYRWKGEVCTDAEVAVIFKTGAAQADACAARIVALHPYDEPAVVRLGVQAEGSSAGFLAWIAEQTASPRGS